MNLLDKRLGLIFSLAFFLISCEDPNEIGLPLNPNQNNVSTKFIELALDNFTVLIDTIANTNGGNLLVGNYVDPEFGEVRAEAYSELIPVGIPDLAEFVLDSVEMELVYSYFNGQDLSGTQTFRLHTLNDTLPFFNNFASQPQEISEDHFAELNVTIDPEKDTLIFASLDTSSQVIKDLSAVLVAADYATQFDFKQQFPGIAIVPVNNTSVVGFSTTESGITLYYSNPTDSSTFNFPLSIGAAGTSYNYIQADRSGTPLNELTEFYSELVAPNDMLYVQSGTGVLTKIDFSDLLSFTDTLENAIINQAELQIGPINAFGEFLVPPGALSFVPTDSSNLGATDPELLINREIASGVLGLTYNADDKIYSGPVTNLIQLVINGESEKTQIILRPSSLENAQTVNRFTAPASSATLKIFYTTFTQ